MKNRKKQKFSASKNGVHHKTVGLGPLPIEEKPQSLSGRVKLIVGILTVAVVTVVVGFSGCQKMEQQETALKPQNKEETTVKKNNSKPEEPIAQIEGQNIYLYPGKINAENFCTSYTVSINGSKKEFPWYGVPDQWHTLYYTDLNGDQKEELIIVISESHGTGCSINGVHILNPENFTEYAVEDPLECVKNRVKTRILSNKEFEITADQTVSNVQITTVIDNDVKEITHDNWKTYEVIDGQLVAQVGLELDTSFRYLGEVSVVYAFEVDHFVAKEVTFVEAENE